MLPCPPASRTSCCSPHAQSGHGGLPAPLPLSLVLSVPSSRPPFLQCLPGRVLGSAVLTSHGRGAHVTVPTPSRLPIPPLSSSAALTRTRVTTHLLVNASPRPERKRRQSKDFAPSCTAGSLGSRRASYLWQALEDIYRVVLTPSRLPSDRPVTGMKLGC